MFQPTNPSYRRAPLYCRKTPHFVSRNLGLISSYCSVAASRHGQVLVPGYNDNGKVLIVVSLCSAQAAARARHAREAARAVAAAHPRVPPRARPAALPAAGVVALRERQDQPQHGAGRAPGRGGAPHPLRPRPLGGRHAHALPHHVEEARRVGRRDLRLYFLMRGMDEYGAVITGQGARHAGQRLHGLRAVRWGGNAGHEHPRDGALAAARSAQGAGRRGEGASTDWLASAFAAAHVSMNDAGCSDCWRNVRGRWSQVPRHRVNEFSFQLPGLPRCGTRRTQSPWAPCQQQAAPLCQLQRPSPNAPAGHVLGVVVLGDVDVAHLAVALELLADVLGSADPARGRDFRQHDPPEREADAAGDHQRQNGVVAHLLAPDLLHERVDAGERAAQRRHLAVRRRELPALVLQCVLGRHCLLDDATGHGSRRVHGAALVQQRVHLCVVRVAVVRSTPVQTGPAIKTQKNVRSTQQPNTHTHENTAQLHQQPFWIPSPPARRRPYHRATELRVQVEIELSVALQHGVLRLHRRPVHHHVHLVDGVRQLSAQTHNAAQQGQAQQQQDANSAAHTQQNRDGDSSRVSDSYSRSTRSESGSDGERNIDSNVAYVNRGRTAGSTSGETVQSSPVSPPLPPRAAAVSPRLEDIPRQRRPSHNSNVGDDEDYLSHPSFSKCAVSNIADKYFKQNEWVAALVLSAFSTVVTTTAFLIYVNHIPELQEKQLFKLRWFYSVATDYVTALCAFFTPNWRYAFICIVEKAVFTLLTMHSTACPINRFRCGVSLEPAQVFLSGVVVIVFFRLQTRTSGPATFLHIALDMLGYLYIIGSLSVIVAFVDDERLESYRKLLIVLLYVVWASDTGAYLTGKILERCHYSHYNPLASHLSKNKDYEGTLGAVFFGVTAMFISSDLLNVPGSAIAQIGFTVLAVVVGRLGDLFESLLKRAAGVKDSGKLIPGHGVKLQFGVPRSLDARRILNFTTLASVEHLSIHRRINKARIAQAISEMMNPKPTALVPVAMGSVEIEVAAVCDVLARGGVQPVEFCVNDEYNVIAIPGTPGAKTLGACRTLTNLLNQKAAGKLYGEAVYEVLFHNALVQGPMAGHPIYELVMGDLYSRRQPTNW
ncbi:hypothetical protein ON010_g11174 [Phytophthora cinnamomi]|nr:hypothetical protein ON010_g11174 [Phytophthora cinnamomi]